MKPLFLGLAFLLELIAFISFSAIGYVLTINSILKIALFIVLLVLLLSFWSLFMAPKATKKFGTIPYYISKFVIYAVSAITIFGTHGTGLGTTFITLCVIDELFLFRHNLQ